tara:strand:+ start:1161 stop:1487 length:327 start_codon:yes stop_codon:yes gene_type:complete
MKNMLKYIKNYATTMGWILLPPSLMRYDLQLHARAGIFMVIPFYIFPHFSLGLSKGLAFTIATLLSFAVAFTKEYMDSKEPNNKFDWLDLFVTVIFTVVPCIMLMIFR